MYKKFLNDSCGHSASFAVRAQGAGPPSGVRIYLAADNTCIETKPHILRTVIQYWKVRFVMSVSFDFAV